MLGALLFGDIKDDQHIAYALVFIFNLAKAHLKVTTIFDDIHGLLRLRSTVGHHVMHVLGVIDRQIALIDAVLLGDSKDLTGGFVDRDDHAVGVEHH